MSEAGLWIFGIVVLVAIVTWLYICSPIRKQVAKIGELSVQWQLTDSDMDMLAKYIGVEIDKMIGVDNQFVTELPTGWQGWEGGFNPLLQYSQSTAEVVVMLRNGTIMRPCCAADLDWYHGERAKSNDIVAWRVA